MMLRSLFLLAALASPQDAALPALERWRSGTEEERLAALRDASAHRKDWGDAALARFAEPPVAGKWSRPDELMDVVAREKLPAWYALLLPLFRHADPVVRGRAIEELGRPDLRSYSASVVPLLKDPEIRVAWNAAFTLVQMDARDRVPETAALLKDPDGSVRMNVLHVLYKLGSKEHGPLMAPLLDDPDSSVVLGAIQALGRFKARDYSGRVARFLESADPVQRQEAIAALSGMGARDAAEKISERLTDAEILVRWEAIRALGHLKAREYAGAIVSMGDEDGAQAPLLEAIAELGLRELAPNILPNLEIPDPGIRWRAVRALGCVDAKDDAARIAAMLKDSDSYVRLSTLQALAAIGTREYVPEMLALLRDEEADVCKGTADEACLLATPAQLKAVEPLLSDGEPFTRWSALQLLVGAQSRAALPGILESLKKSGPPGDLYWAIGRLDARDQKDTVTEGLKAEDIFVRQQAIFALARLSETPDALEAIEKTSTGASKMAAGFALVRLGRKDRAAAAALFKEYLKQKDEPDYQLLPDEVSDALLAGFEKPLNAALGKEVRFDKRIDTAAGLRTLLAQAGVAVDLDESVELQRRLPPGSRVSARRALEWSFGSGTRLVPVSGKILVTDTARALELWKNRLDAP
jgi:HEAT repeat protein